MLPERVQNKDKFSMLALVTSYVPEVDVNSLHNAIDDVKALKKLIENLAIPSSVLIEESKSIALICDEEKNKNRILLNKASLNAYKKNISTTIINKMAECGITQQVLKLAFEKSGNQGLRSLLRENVNGKPRVTKNKNVLQKIYNIFATIH